MSELNEQVSNQTIGHKWISDKWTIEHQLKNGQFGTKNWAQKLGKIFLII